MGCICLIPPEHTVHEEDVIEVVAPIRVMSRFNLNFGDRIRLRLSELH